jgi:hypothetical protein
MPPSEAVSRPSSSTGAAPEQQRLQRVLKIVVGTLAILLFAGLAVAVARVIYLASAPVAQPLASVVTAAPTPAPAIRPEQSLELPAGAQVRSVSLSGNRLAVHYDVGVSSGIAVLDLQTGRVMTNVAVEAKAGGR